MLSNNNNLRCKYNATNVHHTNARTRTRLRGYDIIDKSRQYYATIRIANTYEKTEYVKYNGSIQKLKSVISQLRYKHNQYYINSDRTYITILENNVPVSYKITYTNACLVKGNKIDRKQQARIYKGK